MSYGEIARAVSGEVVFGESNDDYIVGHSDDGRTWWVVPRKRADTTRVGTAAADWTGWTEIGYVTDGLSGTVPDPSHRVRVWQQRPGRGVGLLRPRFTYFPCLDPAAMSPDHG
jgi:hypothetical protein